MNASQVEEEAPELRGAAVVAAARHLAAGREVEEHLTLLVFAEHHLMKEK